jgi:RNA polymerase nonessential primary-like sigma factor
MKKFQKPKVQRHLRMRLLLSGTESITDEVIQPYVRLIEVQERLASELGHRPSLEQLGRYSQYTRV